MKSKGYETIGTNEISRIFIHGNRINAYLAEVLLFILKSRRL